MTGLSNNQVTELVARLHDYLGGWQRPLGRRRSLGLFNAVVLVVYLARHNPAQDVAAELFGISQSTVSRIWCALSEPIAAVCDCEVPDLAVALAGRIVLADGTLTPTGNRAAHPVLYSGKRHRAGAALQVLTDLTGRLLHVADPLPGSIHDAAAWRESGLADALAEHLASGPGGIGDLGYLGTGLLTPIRRPPGGELTPDQEQFNTQVSALRVAVERGIAHLKNWKILATGYRGRLADFQPRLQMVVALEHYRLNWMTL